MELWKDIKGYEGFYQVSDMGRVRSLNRIDNIGRRLTGKILIQMTDKDGYLMLGLSKQSKSKKHKVHRLVACAFIPNKECKPEVNHIDENKKNNYLKNLEWSTRKENENHGTKRERTSKSFDYIALAQIRSKTVIQSDLNGNLVKEWGSLAEINRTLGYSCGNISSCCNGKLKKVYNSVWSFKKVS